MSRPLAGYIGYDAEPTTDAAPGIWTLREAELYQRKAQWPISLLLDVTPSAAAAYSLRLLRRAYASDVILARRSSDNAELGFTATEIADGTLASWAGANDAFVKTWYDQSGNARNATMTTSANQPKIVSSGSLVTENGKPAMEFDGTSDSFDVPDAALPTASFFCHAVTNLTSKTSAAMIIGRVYNFGAFYVSVNANNAATNASKLRAAVGNYTASTEAPAFSSLNANGGQKLLVAAYDETNVSSAVNGDAFNSAAFASAIDYHPNDDSKIGAYQRASPLTAVGFFQGKMQEIVLWHSDKASSRGVIESDVNGHYSIF